MKRFYELSGKEQDKAVAFATRELKDCIEKGIIAFDKPISSALLTDYAFSAAAEAWYSEEGDKVIEDIAGEE